MNSKNSKTSHPHRLLLNLTDKINLNRSNKYVALSNVSIYYTWKNTKKSYKNNKIYDISFEIEWIDWITWSYSVLDIFKKHKEKDDNPSIRIYVNKIENRITFKIKTGWRWWKCTLGIIEVVSIHRNMVNKDYHQDSKSIIYICSW